MAAIKNLPDILKKYTSDFAPIVPYHLNHPSLLIFDLTVNNTNLQQVDLTDTNSFNQFIFGEMDKANTPVAIGRYNENRIIYRRSTHFQTNESRSIHLGIDIWAEAGTEVYSPLDGRVHSFRNNEGFGDYGPTIIIEHLLDDVTFFTLYGHLSVTSLMKLKKNQEFRRGQKLGEIGPFPENGDWPPHLHFQIITGMQSYEGDFPGVASPSAIYDFLKLCPDPNLILGIEKLSKNI